MAHPGVRGTIWLAVTLAASTWASAASAYDARCAKAQQMVAQQCGATQTSAARLSARRCARARTWLRDNCSDAPPAPVPARRAKAKDGTPLAQAPARAARKRARIGYLVAERPPGVRHHRGINQRWQGWSASCCGGPVFHHQGQAYRGGSPYGPAEAHNGFEGGFHPTVFYKLSDRFGRY
jgi:hypothetical protein